MGGLLSFGSREEVLNLGYQMSPIEFPTGTELISSINNRNEIVPNQVCS